MSAKPVILNGDTTTHGGTVIVTGGHSTWENIKIAHVGDDVFCPLCKGMFEIIDSGSATIINGNKIATAGMITSCGAILIPSQHQFNAI
ncbi:PAAR domain-containing protein [Serratia silvae]|uniref:PAAR domain-containing protein n=1 Tax=Serratia silvae TaxID=2824122 RepID=A0ABT0KBU4_9GAMM|nr:PAAR domain-containing protein [Serratia silvae]MCL1029416.1 PAAR domain-containing protein [Serratia silvae]